jgi:hypothetical protein
VQVLRDLIIDQLTRAVEAGEIGADDLELRASMLFETYLSNYPQAIFEGWMLESLQDRSRDQIRILLAGARRG